MSPGAGHNKKSTEAKPVVVIIEITLKNPALNASSKEPLL